MAARKMLIWGTGCEEVWTVRVEFGRSGMSGFREVTGAIECSQGRICLTNYESLTMAASHQDVQLPEQRQVELARFIPAGAYHFRIIPLPDAELELALSLACSADWT